MTECDQLEKEIQKLKYELSVTIPEEIQTAIQAGDLRENSEFSEAVSRQNYTSVRLHQLNRRMEVCKTVYSMTHAKDVVNVGAKLKVKNHTTNKIQYFRVVLAEISDTIDDKYTEITLQSPLGKAFYNRIAGDNVTARLPKESITYKILDICY